jgi:hypothetical protein
MDTDLYSELESRLERRQTARAALERSAQTRARAEQLATTHAADIADLEAAVAAAQAENASRLAALLSANDPSASLEVESSKLRRYFTAWRAVACDFAWDQNLQVEHSGREAHIHPVHVLHTHSRSRVDLVIELRQDFSHELVWQTAQQRRNKFGIPSKREGR